VGVVVFFFFFQAEDGIRDWSVTGVQTCALPIWTSACQGLGKLRLDRRRKSAAATDRRRCGATWQSRRGRARDRAQAGRRGGQWGDRKAACRGRGGGAGGGGGLRGE